MRVESERAVAGIKRHCYGASAVHSFLQSIFITLRHKCITLHQAHKMMSSAETTYSSDISVVLVKWIKV